MTLSTSAASYAAVRRGETAKHTTCSFHCYNSCVLKVRVRDGVIVGVEPDDTINPGITRDEDYLPEDAITRGLVQRRPCAKGYAWRQKIYDPNRVKYPMKRVGERGAARFERISWDEALDTIAAKLVETKERYGPYSILHHPYSHFGQCSFPLAPWFEAGVSSWQCHSTAGWHQPVLWVLGVDEPPLGGLSEDELNILSSRLIVLWGNNPVGSWNNGTPVNTLLRAKKLGIPIVCIDARFTPTAEVVADQWIPIRPTTDVAMAIAMANVWFKEGLCDQQFIDKYVEPEGLARWKAYVLGSSDAVDKTPSWAEEICGVPATTIEAFARLYAASKPVNLMAALTLGRQFFGENQTRAMMDLQALTGNTLLPGGSAPQTGIWMGARGAFGSKSPTPSVNWQQKPGPYKAPILMECHKWPKAIDLREKLDRGEIGEDEYNNQIGNLPGNPVPNIQLVIAESNNHGVTMPETNATIRALKKVSFVLVWAHSAEMAVARYADILLPLPYTAFEGGPSVGWGRWTTGFHRNNVLMFRQKCVDMPGEMRPNEWVWTEVARRLGIAEVYNPRMVDVPYEQWDEVVEGLQREAYERWAAQPEFARLNPPSWEKFQEKPSSTGPTRECPPIPWRVVWSKGRTPSRAPSRARWSS